MSSAAVSMLAAGLAIAPSTTEAPRLLERIRALDASRHASRYLGLSIGGRCVGQVEQTLVPILAACTSRESGTPLFEVSSGGRVAGASALRLTRAMDGTEGSRSAALDVATDALIAAGILPGRHGERFDVAPTFGAPRLATVDRNAAQVLGTTSSGVHVHCYVPGLSAGEPPRGVWLAQRAADKSYYPSCWDPTAAGGLASGMSVRANAEKEAAEEAGVSAELFTRAVATGALSLMTSRPDGSRLKQSVYLNFDLPVPADWQPTAADGEVQAFRLMPMRELEAEVRAGSGALRPAMVAVMLDFLIRHGVVTADSEPDYVELLAALHRDRLHLCDDRDADDA